MFTRFSFENGWLSNVEHQKPPIPWVSVGSAPNLWLVIRLREAPDLDHDSPSASRLTSRAAVASCGEMALKGCSKMFQDVPIYAETKGSKGPLLPLDECMECMTNVHFIHFYFQAISSGFQLRFLSLLQAWKMFLDRCLANLGQ